MFFYQLLSQTADTPSGVISFIDKLARTPVSIVVLCLAVCTLIRMSVFPVLRTTPIHKRFGNYSFFKILNELLDAFVYAGLFVFLIIRPYFVQTFYIPSESMLDTLKVSDYIIGNKLKYRLTDPDRGDIVIFKAGPYARDESKHIEDLIKRLIGLPGDTIEVKDGLLYRDGVKIVETYLREPRMLFDFKLVQYKGQTWPVVTYGDRVNDLSVPMPIAPPYALSPNEGKIVKELPAIKIPTGYYLMMGDNRNGSYDGRFWGLVPRVDIVAKAECIWMPLSRIRITE